MPNGWHRSSNCCRGNAATVSNFVIQAGTRHRHSDCYPIKTSRFAFGSSRRTGPWNRLHQGHGPGGRYKGHYRPAALADWSPRIRCWKKQGYDVYMYFDNAAPADALKLAQLLK
jgi:uncharacterized protein YecE (DUF72 family)